MRSDGTGSGLRPSPLLLAWAGVAVVYVLFRSNLVHIPLERDEGAFGYVAQVLLDGGLPYVDAADHKPPVVYALYALALLLTEPTAAGVHLFAHALNFLTTILLALAAARLADSRAAGVWTALVFAVFSSSASVQGFSASSELLMLLPLSGSLLLATAGRATGRLAPIACSGLLAAIACWTKPVAAASLLPVLVLAVAGSRTVRCGVTAAACWLGGGLVASALVVLPFAVCGAIDELIYWVFGHNLAYAGDGAQGAGGTAAVGRWFGVLAQGDGLPLLIALAGCVALLRAQPRTGLFLTAFLLFSEIGTLPGYGYPHYYMQMAPAIALAAGCGINLLCRRTGRWRVPVSALLAALLLLPPWLIHADYYWRADPRALARASFGLNPFPEAEPVAAYLREASVAGDAVFVLGSEAEILFLAGRRSPTRHILMYPLLRAFPRHCEFQSEALAALRGHPPRFIVVSAASASFHWDGRASLEFVSQVNAMLARDYHPVAWTGTDYADPRLERAEGESATPPAGALLVVHARR